MKEAVTAETNPNGKKTRKSPVPKSYDRIIQGALNLPLADRIDLKNSLSSSIENELNNLETAYLLAKKLIGA